MAERRSLTEHPVYQLTRARLLELFREPEVVFWVFGFPILIGIGLGLAFRDRPPEKAEIALVGTLGPAEQALLSASPDLSIKPMTREEADLALKKTRVDLVVEPEGNGFVYRFDAAQPKSRFARLAVERVIAEARGQGPRVRAREETPVLPGTRYVDFLVPGLLGLNLMGSSMWGVGYAIVDARSRKLMKRFAATPMVRGHYLASFVLARLTLLLGEVTMLLGFGWLAFDVVIRGSVLAVGFLALLGAGSFAGIALLIAARAQKPEVASGWMNFVMMPMWLLSGAFFSYERFPEVIHPLLRVLPLTALNDALRAVMNDGAGLGALGPELAVLIIWCVVPFALALRLFRWQ